MWLGIYPDPNNRRQTPLSSSRQCKSFYYVVRCRPHIWGEEKIVRGFDIEPTNRGKSGPPSHMSARHDSVYKLREAAVNSVDQ